MKQNCDSLNFSFISLPSPVVDENGSADISSAEVLLLFFRVIQNFDKQQICRTFSLFFIMAISLNLDFFNFKPDFLGGAPCTAAVQTLWYWFCVCFLLLFYSPATKLLGFLFLLVVMGGGGGGGQIC